VAHVCDDIACRLNGAELLCQELASRLGPSLNGGSPAADPAHVASGTVEERARQHGATTGPANAVGWQRSPCLGQCDVGPAALVIRAGAVSERFAVAPVANAATLVRALQEPPAALQPRAIGRPRDARLLARVGTSDPERLESYRAHGGYQALARAIAIGPDRVIEEVSTARLLGRGGAAFPTGRKWDAVRRQAAMPHYVVCNADESEPGTFKDRVLLECDPYAVIEAMTICALATRSRHGFIYIRGEYPLAESRIAAAIAQARAAGLLGPDVTGSGEAFDIEVRRGGGAYICGEETALFNSIEGKRGEPRSKPPFPAEVGLFGKPTVANNVETLVNVIDILREGGEAWARVGTADSTGPRLFCLSGHVARPGLYEVPFGTTLRQVIALGGGVAGGRVLKAVLLGGAAGSFVGPEHLDLPLTFEAARAAGTTLGSGVVMVFDESADVSDALERIAAFFRHESCGQCVPCRVGTVRQQELVAVLASAVEPDRSSSAAAVYAELSLAMKDASICGLGQTASTAIESALRLGLVRAEKQS
jgi:NADH-quinone oxidoreductase subunit F